MTAKYLSFLLFIFILFLCSCKNKAVFTKLPVEETNINFSNRITELDTMNVLTFEYVNNGGGVALGDFNNDKLVDVYFTGNQVDNKLFLNKGDFKFQDVSKKANVEGKGKWCSGVALVDINNDKLLDIYVCATVKKVASERANLLYVNQGMGKDGVPIFKEMAQEYGIADTTHSTNATFFDYDNDGDLDLYILVNEMDDSRFPNKYHDKVVDGSSKRTDKLYRNDSSPLTPRGGTLESKSRVIAPPLGAGGAVPHFTDVSKEAGILIEGYGLGVNITDINRDGWKDIYVTNDYLTNDLLYINNRNGTFTDQADDYFKHTSYSAMGNDVEDLNNDGLMDILAVDMMPADNYRKKMMISSNNYLSYQNNEQFHYNYQYPRNTLQINQGVDSKTGKPVFSEIGLLAGIAETDWSWTPMVTDFDNDGFKDIIITNGFPKDITDQDFMVYHAQVSNLMTPVSLLPMIPSVKISNYAFKNNGNLHGSSPQFENVTKNWGMDEPSFSNGAAYADLDNDGDLDYVVNNINDSASVYRNNSIQLKPKESNYLRVKLDGLKNNINGIGAFVEISYGNGQKQIYENTPYRGYLSTIENVVHFGLGKIEKIDELKVTWQSGKSQIIKNISVNQVLTIDERLAISSHQSSVNSKQLSILRDITDSLSIDYTHREIDAIDFNIQKLLPHKLSQFGPSIVVGDVDGDGLEDVFVGGSSYHKGVFLLQSKTGKFTKSDLILGETDATKPAEDMGCLLFDVDRDGDLDLYVVSGSNELPKDSPEYQDRFYENDGKGHFKQNKNALPRFLKSGSCVKAIDYDHDGDLDLFVGGRMEVNAYPKAVSSYILRNDSRPSPLTPRGGTKKTLSETHPLGVRGDRRFGAIFTDVTAQIAPNLRNIGLVCDALWTDFDNDGWMDLMLAGEWMPITILKNNQGKSFIQSATKSLNDKIGFWNSLTAGDFDNDGDVDYVAANLGTNTLNQASDEFPLTIYAKDFNGDGNFDAIPTVFYRDNKGKRREVTFHGRDDLSKQMNTMRKKFDNYQKFALAGINDILSSEDLKGALIMKANYLKSSYIENVGKGEFKISALPIQAQTAPINGMLTEDFDDDGNLDILMVGNDYGNEVSVGRLDAFNGLLMKGNGKGLFKPLSMAESAFCVGGDAKGLIRVTNSKGKPLIISTQNRAELRVFSGLKDLKAKPLQINDVVVLEKLKNGKIRRVEVGYGTSFLSQSSRSVLLSPSIKSVEVIDNQGNKRLF